MNWIVRRETAIALNFLLVLAITAFSAPVVLQTHAGPIVAGGEDAGALVAVNRLREEADKSTLVWSDKLARAAEKKAKDILENNYFEHTSPDGRSPWSFVLGEDYDYKHAGENLAIDFDDVSQAIRAWEESPSHYRNIMSEKYSDFGFAAAEGEVNGRQTKVFVQFFGREFKMYERAFSN